MEVTEDGRPPPPPATGLPSGIPGSMPPLPPRPDYRPGGSGNFSGSNNNGGKAPAVQFRIVEGEYWQKGKKRPRGQKNRN
ncbi:MAG TPA: hypothetical protein PKC28_09815, partial [Bdellovibrionales bacterium]|nr:hypothetical protein [Bdellovibrionales bacterium]